MRGARFTILQRRRVLIKTEGRDSARHFVSDDAARLCSTPTCSYCCVIDVYCGR